MPTGPGTGGGAGRVDAGTDGQMPEAGCGHVWRPRQSAGQGPGAGAGKDGRMSETEDYRDRIGQAFARIGEALERLEPVPVHRIDPAEVEALRAELAEERVVQAQLEERIRGLKDKHDKRAAEFEAAMAAERERMAALDHELQRLRQSNADLRDVVGQLRAALAEEVSEPELVNRAMVAEIEALRATRAADLAEIEAVFDALRPHIGEAM